MRCFVAIELPSEVHRALAALQARLRSLGPAVRWIRPEQIHLTVKFLGEVAEGNSAAVCKVVQGVAARCQPVQIEVCGTGCFPPLGPARIVWAGITGPPQGLVDCQQACEQEFAELGFQPEHRPYRPHLTVGRIRDPRGSQATRSAIDQQAQFAGGTFLAAELVLFQSVLHPSGPTYTVLARAPFA